MASMLVFDLETTGVDPQTAKIVEVGIFLYERGKNTRGITEILNPGEPIPAEASAVHGITDEAVEKCPTFAEWADKAKPVELFRDAWKKGWHIVAYNGIGYDLPLFNRELALAAHSRLTVKITDPLLWIREHYLTMRNKTLSSVYENFVEGSLMPSHAHRVGADCFMTCQIAQQLIDNEIMPADRTTALREQAKIAKRHAEDFKKYGYWLRVHDGQVKLACGKHVGKPLAAVSGSYIRWVLENVNDLPEGTRQLFRGRVK